MEQAIIVALIAALPGIIAALGALQHSRNTRSAVTRPVGRQPTKTAEAAARAVQAVRDNAWRLDGR